MPFIAEAPENPPVQLEEDDAVDALFQLVDKSKFKMVDLFRSLDTDGDGTVDLPELHRTLKRLGIRTSKAATASFFTVLDVDGDGSCTIAEFYERMRVVQLERRSAAKAEKRRKAIADRKIHSARSLERMEATAARVTAYDKITKVERSPAADAALGRIISFLENLKYKMSDLFSLIDADDSGFIDKLELHSELTRLGMSLSMQEAEELCSSLDIDGDGTVERGEFFERYKELYRERRRAKCSSKRDGSMRTFRSLGPEWHRTKDAGAWCFPSNGKHAWRASYYKVSCAALSDALVDFSPTPPTPPPPNGSGRPRVRPSTAGGRLQSKGTRPGSAAATRPGSADRRPGAMSTVGTYADALLAKLDTHKLKLFDLFGLIDEEGSGAIDQEELRTLFMLIGVDLSEQESSGFLNSDGNVTFDEFLGRIQVMQRERAAQNEGERSRLPLEQQHPTLAYRSTGGAQAAAAWKQRWSGQQAQKGVHAALISAPDAGRGMGRPQSAVARLQAQRASDATGVPPRVALASNAPRSIVIPGRGLPARCFDLRGEMPWVR